VTAWAGRDGEFRLYEDAGDGLDHKRRRAFTRIGFDDHGAAGSQIVIGAARGDYPGRARRRAWELRIVGVERPRMVAVNGRAPAAWSYDEATRTVTIRTPRLATNRPVTVGLRS
jgi:hypothetical protein